MRKFYRNSHFVSALFQSKTLPWLLGGTALVLVCVGALIFAPEPEENVEVPQDSHQVSAPLSQPAVSDTSTDSEEVSSSDVGANAPVEEPVDDVSMILPVQGKVGTDFSSAVPVFSETMKDWRVHQGIDFLTDGEAEVYAAADGIVDQVYTSELMGLTVEILHADGTRSLYQSLSGEAEVIPGQEVFQGDVLGKTGISADSECLAGNHLHFALLREGVFLDPNDRFIS